MSIVKEHPVKALPFTKQLGFRREVTHRVEQYLKDHNLPQRGAPEIYVKSLVILAWYVGSYLLIVLGGFPWYITFGLYAVYALAVAAIGFNVMHDANHGSYSRSSRLNKLLSLSMELAGSSSMQWRYKHNVLHHTYTNVAGMDEDLETNGLLRLSPHDEWKPMHRWQHIYLPFVYALTSFGFLSRDFRVYFTGKSDEWHTYPRMSLSDHITFWGGKLAFFTINLGIPLLVLPWWQAVFGHLLVMVTIGITLASIFQLAHVMDVATFPEPVGNPLHVENEWAVHQVETTVNYSPGNKLLNWYAGGLNFQIEHHLFPHICHVQYSRIAGVVKQTCEEFGVKYHQCMTYPQALRSHWHEVQILSRNPALAPA